MTDTNVRINEVLDKFTPEAGSFVAAQVAADAYQYLVDNEPDLLHDWLSAHGRAFLTEACTMRLRSQRATAAKRSTTRAFASAAERFAGGDAEPMTVFQTTHVVAADNTRRYVGDMVGSDHLYVAEQYAQSANHKKLMAEFHRAVGKKVGKKRTADVMEPSEYVRLMESITSRSAA